ncbi:putative cytochrome [Zancudomyces culisetae]|uniref:Putative cytochrome n=1 Tax=Zancudomyces culisetae TaxID=1213189 RepID=A0A1R1PFS4_ZANCU|nr:putative cytochrome [Zancudomyces culisetae]|eukprot:OMH79763.1 putative cytochrome [Zancudomyces culisetae]
MELAVVILSIKLYSALVNLSLRPNIYEELLAEQQMLIDKYSSATNAITMDVIDQMVLLDAYLKESIRYSPTSTLMPRACVRDIVLSNGVTIKKNQYVGVNIHAYNRTAEAYGTKPSTFDYKRHIRLGTTLLHSEADAAIWGIGTAACPSKLYTIYTMKLIMALVIRNFRVKHKSLLGNHGYVNTNPLNDSIFYDIKSKHELVFQIRN